MTGWPYRLLRTWHGACGLIILAPIVFAVVLGPAFAPYDPNAISFMARLTPPALGHWFGTDEFGRDLLSRILVGARESVGTAVTATALGTLSGAIIGTVSAYLGGRADEAIMRTIDAVPGDSRTAAGAADP